MPIRKEWRAMKRVILSIGAASAMAWCVLGCQSSGEHAEGENCTPAKEPNTVGRNAVNTNCPLTGEVADQSVVEEYNGVKIAFCCAQCATKFRKMSEGQKTHVLTTATTYPSTMNTKITE